MADFARFPIERTIWYIEKSGADKKKYFVPEVEHIRRAKSAISRATGGQSLDIFLKEVDEASNPTQLKGALERLYSQLMQRTAIPFPPPVDGKDLLFWTGHDNTRSEWGRWFLDTFSGMNFGPFLPFFHRKSEAWKVKSLPAGCHKGSCTIDASDGDKRLRNRYHQSRAGLRLAATIIVSFTALGQSLLLWGGLSLLGVPTFMVYGAALVYGLAIYCRDQEALRKRLERCIETFYRYKSNLYNKSMSTSGLLKAIWGSLLFLLSCVFVVMARDTFKRALTLPWFRAHSQWAYAGLFLLVNQFLPLGAALVDRMGWNRCLPSPDPKEFPLLTSFNNRMLAPTQESVPDMGGSTVRATLG